MILIGDTNIDHEQIVKISSISDISSTPSNSTVLFTFDFEILKYTETQAINSAVIVSSIKEVIYASNLGACYIIPTQEILQQSQKIADNYMFDSKILAIIDDESQIEKIALDEIDGAIYKNILND